MRKFTRTDSPEVLNEVDNETGKANWQIYGERYEKNRLNNPSFEFQWPILKGKKLNHYLLPLLTAMTNYHCSYCDGAALKKGENTIDHFYPKSLPEFYLKVCQWENLYIACNSCQISKGNQSTELLLRPDEIDYDFNKYFVYDYEEHYISSNPLSTIVEQNRAKETIKILDLNHLGMRKSRKRDWNLYNSSSNPILSDYNFRFMFDE